MLSIPLKLCIASFLFVMVACFSVLISTAHGSFEPDNASGTPATTASVSEEVSPANITNVNTDDFLSTPDPIGDVQEDEIPTSSSSESAGSSTSFPDVTEGQDTGAKLNDGGNFEQEIEAPTTISGDQSSGSFLGESLATAEFAISSELETSQVLPTDEITLFDNRILLGIDSSILGSDMGALSQFGSLVPSELGGLGIFVLDAGEGDVIELVGQLQSLPGVIFAEPNYYVQSFLIPDDPFVSSQYGLDAIGAYQAWDYATGLDSVTIAVLDTGIDLSHPEFVGRLVSGYDIVNSDSDPQDDNGHGTSVAGVAAATANNSEGIAGLNWGAWIMPVKVLNSSGVGTYADVASGIVWAANNGGDVINLSLGGSSTPPSTALLDAINYAQNNGLVIVAAAGNSNSGVFYPATYDGVIAVAATDTTNSRMSSSNYGPEIDLSAPGNAILSTSLGGGYGYSSGTSMAAPYVSGLSAILKALDPSLSPDEIETILETSALDLGALGADDFYGAGLIQADGAILLVVVSPPAGIPIDKREHDEDREQDISVTGQVAQATPTSQATFSPAGGAVIIDVSKPTAAATEEKLVVLDEDSVSFDELGTVTSSDDEWSVYLVYTLVVVLAVAVLYFLFRSQHGFNSRNVP